MLTQDEKNDILALIRQQVVPAIGCTEPMAVALCVAKARQLLGCVPESIDIELSANILKNAMGVGIPGTGMIGLPIAVALGALIGRPELQLEVLHDCNKAAVARGKEYIAEGRIRISLKDDAPDKLYIGVTCSTQAANPTAEQTPAAAIPQSATIASTMPQTAEARIQGEHTNFVYLRQGDNVLLDKAHATGNDTSSHHTTPLTLRTVYDFATQTDIDDLRFILEAKAMNEAAAADGLKENYGHQLGKTMCSPLGKGLMGDSVFAKI